MLLEHTHEQLGWPTPDEVLSPRGEGGRFYARLADEKIGKALSRRSDGEGVRIGVLTPDPEATTAPFALVCTFAKKVSDETLREAHKLAWNFGYASLLITVEPHIVRTWTCCEPPSTAPQTLLSDSDTPEIEPSLQVNEQTGSFTSEEAAASLHWVELLTGSFFQQHRTRFRPEKRADRMLLANLREVRQKLQNTGLDDDTSHDLLARIIFIQFLFDRKDTDGVAALNPAQLQRLYEEGVLSEPFVTLGEILSSYEDTYSLFRWLNERFNGDLFPGKENDADSSVAWQAEQARVQPEHLMLLSRFVRGEERMADGQLSLWSRYAFDAIPLEVISTIYEQFVKKEVGTGVHYTPSHVADLILDSVLPWEGKEWDLKVLDPSCGSGVFLVKAYQRLVHRWKTAHPNQKIGGEVLSQLLTQNIFGVDLDAHAVRTASFSLYLAMCDEIDPRDYWKEVHFPILRGRRLVAADFFSEDHSGFCSTNAPQYDLVVGNPPWGKNSLTSLAKTWQKQHKWTVAQHDIGPLFVARALSVTKPSGYVAMLQPASTALYNNAIDAQRYRKRLFDTVQVEEVINFAALRHGLFRDAIVPACALILRNIFPTGSPFWYVCPKPLKNQEDAYRIVIEPQDVNTLYTDEVLSQPWQWSALLWGGRRDLQFLSRLNKEQNLAKLEAEGIVQAREGIIRGDRKKRNEPIVGRRLVEADNFPSPQEVSIDAVGLPINNDPWIHSLHGFTDLRAFQLPQMIVRQSWRKRYGRFQAVLVRSNDETGAVFCTHSFLSVHAPNFYLDAAFLAYNSHLAVYYLLLTSGRFAMDRNEPETKDFRKVPLPHARPALLHGVNKVEDVDERAHEVYGFKDAEWLLIEDLMQFTLPDYKGGSDSPGRQVTHRKFDDKDAVEPELTQYCEAFLRVLYAAYGKDKPLGAVIYSETGRKKLPVRMVSFFLNLPKAATVRTEPLTSPVLRQRLNTLYQTLLSTEENRHQFYQRTVRTYETKQNNDGEVALQINFIKPDQVRYWTRSMALRDADAVVADMTLWASTGDARKNEFVYPSALQSEKTEVA